MSDERAPRMMSFISEKELEEVKRKRQEEWEKARKPNDPVERPEEVYDPRPLYERLKEQRDRKQEEWEEQFKFKNMIYKGLDDEEAVFLQMVADKKAAHNAEVAMIEKEELSEFRQAVAELAENDSRPLTATSPTSLSSTSKKTSNAKVTPSRTKLASMIGTSIRRKRSSSDSTEQRHSTSRSVQDKKLKIEDSSKDTCTGGHTTASTQDHGDPKVVVAPTKLNTEETSDMQCKTQTMFGSLPGMAEYSNSSDDDEDDN